MKSGRRQPLRARKTLIARCAGAVTMIWALSLGSTAAHANPTAVTPAATWVSPAPASVAATTFRSSTQLRVFAERRNVSGLFTVDAPGAAAAGVTYSSLLPPPAPTTVALGPVDSYLIHGNSTTVVSLNGSVTFDSPVVALIVSGPALNSSDGPLGLATTTYPSTTPARGLEFTLGADALTLSADQKTVSVAMQLSPLDEVRILTAADVTAPSPSISAGPAQGSSVKTTSASFTFAPGELGAAVSCTLDGAVTSPCTSPKSYTGLANAQHSFTVTATDPAGNAGSATRSWTVDTVAPTVTFDSGPLGPTPSSGASFSFHAGEVATFTCSLDAAANVACSSPASYSSLAEGAHTLRVRATDLAGNLGAAASRAWTVDTIKPDTTISAGPANGSSTNTAAATFKFTSTQSGSSFECRLDLAAWQACVSPKPLSGLSDGSHTFDVRATDTAGNTDDTPASRTWTVDTTPPTVSILTGPQGPTASASATFSFSSPDGAVSFQCSRNGGAFAACTSPTTYTPLANGSSQTLAVRGTDAVGNVGPATTRAWTIDLTAPDTTITSGPSGTVLSTSAAFTFTSTEAGSTFACSLDGAPFVSCSASPTFSSLATGVHTLSVRAVDAAGNTDATPAVRAWTVAPPAPPDTAIDSAPQSPSASPEAGFSFHSTPAGATFECRLDGGAFTACSSPATYSALGEGSHSFEVRAVAGGVSDPTPAAATWTIDLTPPDVSIASGPSGNVTATAASFTFSSTDPSASFLCSLDSAFPSTPCSSPQNYIGLTLGSHSFEVAAVDAAGNGSPQATRAWSVVTPLPTVELISTPANPNSLGDQDFDFTVHGSANGFECRVDDQPAFFCSPVVHLGSLGLAEGAHTFGVRARRPADSAWSPETTYTWTIDHTPPDVAISSGPADGSSSTTSTATFSFTTSDPSAHFECALDSAAWAVCSSPQSPSSLSDGLHTFAVRAIDAAGNPSPPAARGWTVDTQAPTVAITSGPADGSRISGTSATFTWYSTDFFATAECRLDTGPWGTCPQSLLDLSEGEHSFSVRLTDTAGNVGPPDSRTWTVDTTPPVVTFVSPPPFATSSRNATITFSASEPATFTCSVDGAGFELCSSPLQLSNLADGSHTVRVLAIDRTGLGNLPGVDGTIGWHVDTTTPDITITGGPADGSSITATYAYFSFTSNEYAAVGNNLGVLFSCRLDRGAWAPCTLTAQYDPVAEGTHTFEVQATDYAGHTSPIASRSWTVDHTAPDTSLDAAPTGLTNSQSAGFSFSSPDGGTSFECRLDGASWDPCLAPLGYNAIADGQHTFEVRATDAAGNVDPTPAQATWTVDATPPETSITDSPVLPTLGSASFSFASSEPGSSFECSQDGSPWAPCASPKTYDAIIEGAHDFQVRATDAAGNTDTTPARALWSVSIPPAPDAVIDSGPSGPTGSTSATFVFHATGPAAGFECRLSDGPPGAPLLSSWARCDASPVSYSALVEGTTYVFDVRAVGLGGSAGPVISHSWTVDVTAPETSIDGGPTGTVSNTAPIFPFSSPDFTATFECRLDGGSWLPCASPTGYPGLADGSHTFDVRATDAVGNTDPTPASRTWTINTTPPPTASGSGAVYHDLNNNGQRDSGEPGINGRRIYFDINANQQYDPATEPTTLTQTIAGQDGRWAFTGPVPPTGISGVTRTVLPTGWHCSQPASPGSAHTDCGYPLTLVPGGNYPNEDFGTYTVDTTIDSAPSGTVTSTSAAPTFSSDFGVAFECRIDGGAFSTCTSPASYAGLADGSHSFEVRAIDQYGNTDPSPASRTWTVNAGPVATGSGIVYEDVNNNGQRDPREAGLGGRRLYFDLNANQQYDPATEPTSITGADGQWSFTGAVVPGSETGTIRTVLPGNWHCSQPASPAPDHTDCGYPLTLQPGGNYPNLDFGTYTIPSSMAAIGDSLSNGFLAEWQFVSPNFLKPANRCVATVAPEPLGFWDCPEDSWSTGDGQTGFDSHYRRILAVNPAIAGNVHNYAVSGAKTAALPAQVQAAIAQGVGYVTLISGGNDICTTTEAQMTPVADFETQLRAAMTQLYQGLPNVRVFVGSLPNLMRSWELWHTNPTAQFVWGGAGNPAHANCQSLLANPGSLAQADVDRRARVLATVQAYNAVLQSVCAEHAPRCRYDGGALYDLAQSVTDANKATTFSFDYWHLTASALGIVGSTTYAAGFNW